MERRFLNFSDDEIYILSRQAMESSANIVLTDRCSKEEQRMHNDLMNELIEERKHRDSCQEWARR